MSFFFSVKVSFSCSLVQGFSSFLGGRLSFLRLILLHDSIDQIVHLLGQGSFAFCEEYMWDHELGVSYASPKQFFLRNFKEYLSAC